MKSRVIEFLKLLGWNVLVYLAFSTLLGIQYNVAGVYGLL
jgi:hypothetical protein